MALLVRIIYNLTVARNYFPLHDSRAYQSIAFTLLDQHCFCWNTDGIVQGVTVSHAPLWPWLIAGISLIVGRANIFDRLFLCLVDAGTCLLIYFFVRDLFSKRIALLAGLFAAIYPALYIYTGWMYTEALSTFLQTAVCYCVLRIQRSDGRNRRLWLLCGVLLAMLSLTHPNGIAIIGLLVVWVAILFWRSRLPREALLNAGLVVLAACLPIAPGPCATMQSRRPCKVAGLCASGQRIGYSAVGGI